jgi:hypothetical protein
MPLACSIVARFSVMSFSAAVTIALVIASDGVTST